jgi:atypical dual specificity phosphatase
MPEFTSHDLTEMPFGLPGRIYRGPMPFGAFDPEKWVLEHALQAGVSVVVDLVPDHEALNKTGKELRSLYMQHGLDVIYLPVSDFEAPPDGGLDSALQTALALARQGKHILVHCNAGYGRTGTFLACLARIALGLDGPQAVSWVRQFIPPALENGQQLDFVYRYNTGRSYAVEG